MKERTILPFFRWSPLWALLLAVMIGVPQFAHADGDDTDFTDDDSDEYVVYRRSPAEGFWFLLSPKTGQTYQYQWGLATDIPVPGQYNNNLHPDLTVYRPSNGVWYMRIWEQTLQFPDMRQVQWGGFPGDVPVPCDYDGNSVQDLGIYRNGSWFLLFGSSFDTEDAETFAWGGPTDLPVPRDYDGDNRCDLAFYRPSVGSFFVLLSTKDFLQSAVVPLGTATDIPIPGFFDGDRRADFAVYRPGFPSQWIILESDTQRLTSRTIPWGGVGDIPLASDFDGDGRMDISVWRPSEGAWYLIRSSDSVGVFQPWGLPNTVGVDVPLARYRSPASYR